MTSLSCFESAWASSLPCTGVPAGPRLKESKQTVPLGEAGSVEVSGTCDTAPPDKTSTLPTPARMGRLPQLGNWGFLPGCNSSILFPVGSDCSPTEPSTSHADPLRCARTAPVRRVGVARLNTPQHPYHTYGWAGKLVGVLTWYVSRQSAVASAIDGAWTDLLQLGV